MSPSSYKIISFYKFFEVADPEQFRQSLSRELKQFKASGLLILGREGINATMSFESDTLCQNATGWLQSHIPDLTSSDLKSSTSDKPPFSGEIKIKIRDEIVTANAPNLVPKNRHAHLSPEAWQRVLRDEKDVVLIDTRNWYESEIGSFRGSIKPPLHEFSEFTSFVKQAEIPKDKKVLMFCTGGIRCEKASLQMQAIGYENVFQLEGGILAYLEKFPNQDFEGECFVFDGRVAVDQNLKPTSKYAFCWACGQPGGLKKSCVRCDDCYAICESCAHAQESAELCSKNCAHQWNLHPGRKGRSQRRAIPLDDQGSHNR